MLNSLWSRWLLLPSSSLKNPHNVSLSSSAAARGMRRRGSYRGRAPQQQQQSSQGNNSSPSIKAFDYSGYSGAAMTAFKVIFYSYAAYFAYTQVSSLINPKADSTASAAAKKKKQQLCLQVESLENKLQSYSDSFREASAVGATGTVSNGSRKQSMHRGRDPQLLMEHLTEKQAKQLQGLRADYHLIAAQLGSAVAAYRECREKCSRTRSADGTSSSMSQLASLRMSYFDVLQRLLVAEEMVVDELHAMFPNPPSSLEDVLRIKNAVLGLPTDPFTAAGTGSSSMGVSVALLDPKPQRRVFVLTFIGDQLATAAVDRLREEVTGVLGEALPGRGDSVVLNLTSGGGTFTGYGLAAAQLVRLKQAKIPLVVCVDEVAASGGYLMAAVADRIIASPFAVLGSIGVIMSIINYSERMSREGISVEDITAGEFKRTLTPYKTPSDADRSKVQRDIDQALQLFKSFLSAHRPSLDVDRVATGEVWYGSDALAKGLVDELSTSDEYILKQYKDGAQVFSVKLVQRKQSWREALEVFGSVSALEKLVHGIVLNAVSMSPLLKPTFVDSHPSSHSIVTVPQDSRHIPRAF